MTYGNSSRAEPGDPGPVAGAPVQPPAWSLDGVDHRTLAEQAGAKVDEAILRRLGDRDLIRALALDNFEGVAYREWQEMQARYGLSVMGAWLYSGQVFRLVKGRGLGISCSPAQRRVLRESADERQDIAGEVVARTFAPFRERALIKGGWTVEGGASLATYFMGATLYQVPNVYRAWERDLALRLSAPIGDVTDRPATARHENPELTVTDREAFEEILARFKPHIAEILYLRATGYQLAEIAEITGKSVRAIEGIIHRARPKLKDLL